MTPARYEHCLRLLGWTKRGLARMLRCARTLTSRWATGEDTVPPKVADWLKARVAASQALPPPRDWRRAPFGRQG